MQKPKMAAKCATANIDPINDDQEPRSAKSNRIIRKTISLPPTEMRVLTDAALELTRSVSLDVVDRGSQNCDSVNITDLVRECGETYQKVEKVTRRMELDLSYIKQTMGECDTKKTLSDEIRSMRIEINNLLQESVVSPRSRWVSRLDACVRNSQMLLESFSNFMKHQKIREEHYNKKILKKLQQIEKTLDIQKVYIQRVIEIEILAREIDRKVNDIRYDMEKIAETIECENEFDEKILSPRTNPIAIEKEVTASSSHDPHPESFSN